MSKSMSNLQVTAHQLKTNRLTSFSKTGTPTVEVPDAVRPSSAAPTFFRAAYSPEGPLVDGGVGNNSPLVLAITQARTEAVKKEEGRKSRVEMDRLDRRSENTIFSERIVREIRGAANRVAVRLRIPSQSQSPLASSSSSLSPGEQHSPSSPPRVLLSPLSNSKSAAGVGIGQKMPSSSLLVEEEEGGAGASSAAVRLENALLVGPLVTSPSTAPMQHREVSSDVRTRAHLRLNAGANDERRGSPNAVASPPSPISDGEVRINELFTRAQEGVEHAQRMAHQALQAAEKLANDQMRIGEESDDALADSVSGETSEEKDSIAAKKKEELERVIKDAATSRSVADQAQNAAAVAQQHFENAQGAFSRREFEEGLSHIRAVANAVVETSEFTTDALFPIHPSPEGLKQGDLSEFFVAVVDTGEVERDFSALRGGGLVGWGLVLSDVLDISDEFNHEQIGSAMSIRKNYVRVNPKLTRDLEAMDEPRNVQKIIDNAKSHMTQEIKSNPVPYRKLLRRLPGGLEYMENLFKVMWTD